MYVEEEEDDVQAPHVINMERETIAGVFFGHVEV